MRFPVTNMIIAATVIAFLGWASLPATSSALLIRNDPMYADDLGVVKDAACIYSNILETVTVYQSQEAGEAICSRVYKLGSAPTCPNNPLDTTICQRRGWWAHD